MTTIRYGVTPEWFSYHDQSEVIFTRLIIALCIELMRGSVTANPILYESQSAPIAIRQSDPSDKDPTHSFEFIFSTKYDPGVDSNPRPLIQRNTTPKTVQNQCYGFEFCCVIFHSHKSIQLIFQILLHFKIRPIFL